MKYKTELVHAILKEITSRKEYLDGESIDTIYFGGGTPSILDKSELAQILKRIHKLYVAGEKPEITLEANPDDLTLEKLNELKDLGINRLSIGIQSFHEDHLLWMNRAHNATESLECLKNAKAIGFENITADLIYGIPMMTDEQWKQNIQYLLDFDIPHISAYNLTVEHKTVLDHNIQKGLTHGPDDAQGERNFNLLRSMLSQNGFIQYEVSNFGKPEYFSRHNTSYWQGKKYLGIGPSAHSFNGSSRAWNVSSNAKYIQDLNENKLSLEVEKLSSKDLINEHLMLGLRNIWGCNWEYLQRHFRFEKELQTMKSSVRILIESGKLEETITGFKSSEQGLLFADGMASSLFVD